MTTFFLKNSLFILASILLVSCLGKSPAPEASNKKLTSKEQKAASNDAAPRKRLMVLPFLDSNDTHPQSLRDNTRSLFISKLNQTGEFIVLGTNDLKFNPSEEMKSGDYTLNTIGPKAAELGISAVLEGRIMDVKVTRQADPVGLFRQVKTKFEVVVRLRIAIAKSGREIFNTTKTVTLEDAQQRVAESVTTDKLIASSPELVQRLVSDAFLDFEPQIVNALSRLSWEGRVALINGDRVFLNVGKISGVQIGDLLRVTEEGEEVFDPQTGVFIGKSPGRLKGTLEVISYFGQDGAIAILHSGAGFKENDRVEQY